MKFKDVLQNNHQIVAVVFKAFGGMEKIKYMHISGADRGFVVRGRE
jgi:hypothetical protein